MQRDWTDTRLQLGRWTETLSIGCLMVLLMTLPFWRHRVVLHRPGTPVFFEFHDIILYTTDILCLGALVSWVLSRLLRRQSFGYPQHRGSSTLGSTVRKMQFGPWFLSGPLVAVLCLSVCGIAFAVDPLFAGYQSTRLLLLLALYLMLVNLPLPPGVIGWPLAAGMVLQAAVALPQFALGRTLGLRRLGEVSASAAWPGASVVMVGESRWLRAYGFSQHPNLLGGCLMAMLLIVSGYYLARSGWRRIPLLAALGLGLTALLLTFSRAAWLGTLVGSVAVAGLLLWRNRPLDLADPTPAQDCCPPFPGDQTITPRRRRAPGWTAIALLVAVGLTVIVAFVSLNWALLEPRLGLTSQGVEIRSLDSRVLQLRAALDLIRARPLVGLGLGNYATALFRLAPETISAYPVYQPVHNVLLLVTAELGVLGGLLWLGILVAPWLGLGLPRGQVRRTAWGAGLSGALLALGTVSFLDSYVWSSHQGRLLFWLICGLWAREWVASVPGATFTEAERRSTSNEVTV